MTAIELRTSALLIEIADGGRDDDVLFDELLERFSRRAFGALLLTVTLPSFLPVPIGVGAISGPLVALLGLQLLLLRRRPWLPALMRRRGIPRLRFRQFAQRMQPWLQRLERFSRPRLQPLIEHPSGSIISGLLLFGIGIVLALPIPFTNYPIGLLVLCYAIALIERDGGLLLLCWVLGLSTLGASLLLSGEVVDLLRSLFGA